MPLFDKRHGADNSAGFSRRAMSRAVRCLLLVVMIIVVLAMSSCEGCGCAKPPSITNVDIEKETPTSAQMKFARLQQEYIEYSSYWTEEERRSTLELEKALAKKAGIDYAPDALPLEPPAGGAGGGTGGYY